MPYLETANTWLTQSTLLIQARPTTTRITTKYTLSKPKSPSTTPSNHPPSTTTTNLPPEPPRATLTLKTYDPVSGTTLKYSTTKAAEVSRLIQILGRLARPMAGLPELKEDVAMSGVDSEAVGSGPGTPAAEKEVSSVAGGWKSAGQGGAGGGAGGKKGKKKGGKK